MANKKKKQKHPDYRYPLTDYHGDYPNWHQNNQKMLIKKKQPL